MNLDCPRLRVILRYTQREWMMLEHWSKVNGNGDMRSALHRKMISLGQSMPEPLDENARSFECREFFIPEGMSCGVIAMSNELNIPLATLVGKIVINPIISSHIREHGLVIPA